MTLDVELRERGGSEWVRRCSGVILAIPSFVIPIPPAFQMFHKATVMLRDEKLAFHFLNTAKYMGWLRIG